MTEEKIIGSYRYRAVFCCVILISLIVAVFAGTTIPTAENRMIIPSGFDGFHGFFQALIRMCILDVALFWALSIRLVRPMRIFVSFLLFVYRGLVIGCSFGVITRNSASSATLLMLGSYCAVTLLALIYDDYLNARETRGFLTRAASCLVVSGGAIAMRIIPMLFIK